MSTKQIEAKSNVSTDSNVPQEVVRQLSTLESMLVFKGERIASGVDKLSLMEGIRVGVALIVKGEDSKARGAFVVADKARALSGDQLADFMSSLKSEVVNESVARVNASLPADMSAAKRDKAKKDAEKAGEARYNNLGQTIRAARFILENPKKIADGISIFTVQQGLAYVKAPTLKEGEEQTESGQSKLECHKVVAKLLATPGTSQNALKQAVSKVKETVAKKHETKDERSPEKKAEDAKVNTIEKLPSRVDAITQSIDELAKLSGVKPGEWRSDKLTASVMNLAILAGLTLAKVEAPSPAKVDKK